jgi:hypothetical protein
MVDARGVRLSHGAMRQVLEPHPGQGQMFETAGFSGKCCFDEVNAQRARRAGPKGFAVMHPEGRPRECERCAKFFVQFPRERFLEAFSWLYLATRKLPATPVLLGEGALSDKVVAVAQHDSGDDIGYR